MRKSRVPEGAEAVRVRAAVKLLRPCKAEWNEDAQRWDIIPTPPLPKIKTRYGINILRPEAIIKITDIT